MADDLVAIDLFVDAMPPDVWADVARGRAGTGPLTAWCAATSRATRVLACDALAVATPAPATLGWVLGITLFDEPNRPLRAIARSGSAGPRSAAGGGRGGSIARSGSAGPRSAAGGGRGVSIGDLVLDDAARRALATTFGIGIAAGLVAMPAHWRLILETVATLPDAAVALAHVIGPGLASPARGVRGVARTLAYEIARIDPARADVLAAETRAIRATAPPELAAWFNETIRFLDRSGTKAAVSLAARAGEGARGDRDDETLLRELVATWRACGDPALESPIAALGAHVANARGAAPVDDATWNVLAERGDPGDVDRLIESVDPGIARATRLARAPSDPRITRFLAQRGRKANPRSAFHAAAANAFGAAVAPSTLDHLDAIERRHPQLGAYLDARARVERGLAERVVDRADPALVAEAIRRTGTGDDLAALWREHLAVPDDDARRAVLGDALQRGGDPRGELIALQLELARDPDGARARAMRDRAGALIEAHGDRWSPITSRVQLREFARGFVVALRTSAPKELIADSCDHPAWVTVEELAIDTACDVGPLVARLPLLRRLALAVPQVLASVPPELPVRGLAVRGAWELAARAFPDLVAIAGRWIESAWEREPFALAQRAAAVRGLAAIVHLEFPLACLGDAIAVARELGPAETRFALGQYHGWRATRWVVRCTRDSPVVELASAGPTLFQGAELTNVVEQILRGGCRALRVALPARPRSLATGTTRRIEELAARTGAAVAFDGAPIDVGAPA